MTGTAAPRATALPSEGNTMESRFEKIETKLSLAEDLLDEMNKTLYRQQRQLEQMRQEMATLRQQIQSAMPAEQRNSADEIPPHY
jgi:SlyX protein